MGRVQSIRCTGSVRRNGAYERCNKKIGERHEDGRFSVHRRDGKVNVTIVLGDIQCPLCGHVQQIPPSPLEDPIVLEDSDVRRIDRHERH